MSTSPILGDSELQQAGDLSSLPSRDRELWSQEVHALDGLIQTGQIPPGDRSNVDDIIRMEMAYVRTSLDIGRTRLGLLNDIITDTISNQLRARVDFLHDNDIIVEQWVPALRSWLVCCRRTYDTPTGEIIADLRAGDPRFESADEALDRKRRSSDEQREANDRAGDEKVLAAVDSLSSRALQQFIEVEEALKVGDTISAHGDDANFIERQIDRTRKAAANGDLAAQRTITHGATDSDLCVNPGDNPLVR